MRERVYPDLPILGVGAVVVGELGVLLVRRDKDPGKGLWSIPGGRVELGETLDVAIHREVLEETGIEIETIRDIGYTDLIMKDSDGKIQYHYFIVHFLTKALTKDVTSETPEAEVKWFPLDTLPKDVPELIVDLIMKHENEITSI